jgi:hypothetical protein
MMLYGAAAMLSLIACWRTRQDIHPEKELRPVESFPELLRRN